MFQQQRLFFPHQTNTDINFDPSEINLTHNLIFGLNCCLRITTKSRENNFIEKRDVADH